MNEQPIRIVSGGAPTAVELAALVAVLAAGSRSASAAEQAPLRQPLSPWVTSGYVKGTRVQA